MRVAVNKRVDCSGLLIHLDVAAHFGPTVVGLVHLRYFVFGDAGAKFAFCQSGDKRFFIP